MTEKTIVLVDNTDGIVKVTVDTERGVFDRCRVVAAVPPSGSGEIVDAVTTGTSTFGDGIYPWPVEWILQHGRVDGANVAITALVGMNSHRGAHRVTTDTERGV